MTNPSLSEKEYQSHCIHWWDTGGDEPGPHEPCCHCGYNGEAETPCEPERLKDRLRARGHKYEQDQISGKCWRCGGIPEDHFDV